MSRRAEARPTLAATHFVEIIARGATERAGMDADAILSEPFGVLKGMDTIERSCRRACAAGGARRKDGTTRVSAVAAEHVRVTGDDFPAHHCGIGRGGAGRLVLVEDGPHRADPPLNRVRAERPI